MKAILKASNNILKTQGKIFQVGEAKPPVLDLNPALLIGLADNTPVSKLNDGSQNGNHAYQPTATAQPKFRTNVLNGLPAIEYDGVNDYLFTQQSVIPKTVFIVAKHRIANSRATMLSSGNAGNTYFAGGNEDNKLFFDGATNVFGGANTNLLWVNGGLINPKSLALRNTVAFTVLSMDVSAFDSDVSWIGNTAFQYGQFNRSFDGLLARFIIFNYRMTDTDRKAKEVELKTVYAL
jgi:hypothetical protein